MLDLNELGEELKKQGEFMEKRLLLIQKEEIDLEKVSQQIDEIMKLGIDIRNSKEKADDLLLPLDFKKTKERLLRNSKEQIIRILCVLV